MRRGAFVGQPLALQYAEAMLLVDNDQPKARKLHGFFDQRVRANHQLRFAAFGCARAASVFFRSGATADDQFHVDSRRDSKTRRAER